MDTPTRSDDESYEDLREELKKAILKRGIVFGENKKNWMFDTKMFLLDPSLLKIATKLMRKKLQPFTIDAIGGSTLASYILASSLCYESKSMEAFMVRKERKQDGMLKIIEGPDISGKKVAIVDDILHGSAFMRKAIDSVKIEQGSVETIIPLINFKKEGYEELVKEGYNIHEVYTLDEFGL